MKSILYHDPSNLFVIHDDSIVIFKAHLHSPVAKFPLALLKHFFYQEVISIVFRCLIFSVPPFVVAGSRCMDNLAECGYADLILCACDQDETVFLVRL